MSWTDKLCHNKFDNFGWVANRKPNRSHTSSASLFLGIWNIQCLRPSSFWPLHTGALAGLSGALFYKLFAVLLRKRCRGRGAVFCMPNNRFSLSFMESSVGWRIFEFCVCPTCMLAAGDVHHREEAVPGGGPTFLHLVACFESKGC